MKKAVLWSGILLLAMAFLLTGCAKNTGESAETSFIQIKGSDTEVNLVQRLAESYMDKHPEIDIAVTGGGSGTGIAALIKGEVDIANSSRAIKDEEIEQAKANGVEPVAVAIAMDGLSVIIHADNPVEALTVEQIGKIFRGEITNWKEVGGPDMEISMYGRQSNSGTFVYFRDHVLKGDFSPKVKRMNGNAQIVESVKNDPAGIGYVGVGYVVGPEGKQVEGIKVIKVAKDENSPPATPLDPENVKNGSYPLARPLYQYVNGKPEGAVLEFIKYELSEEGQQIAVEEGFYPVNPEYAKLNEASLN
ncbi:PstS family phosphate ABC transporter substrate-binding protein [Calderihabitans maritimus]|uniref:Phosphate-binding protein n=1 Tax=Calderihabitans maritimus TaxID=1246530 RepID=A0A1Z5HW74_9FIRM|nr:PstS family phosphate ABC transporter substrate-binding protein [Calderihabitans maritimus]GAW93565.1 phosphate binding protein [Calderihabitans maritimus]